MKKPQKKMSRNIGKNRLLLWLMLNFMFTYCFALTIPYTAAGRLTLKLVSRLTTQAKYTKARRPVKLVYFEELASKSAAMKREWFIKHKMTREQKLKLIVQGEVMINL